MKHMRKGLRWLGWSQARASRFDPRPGSVRNVRYRLCVVPPAWEEATLRSFRTVS